MIGAGSQPCDSIPPAQSVRAVQSPTVLCLVHPPPASERTGRPLLQGPRAAAELITCTVILPRRLVRIPMSMLPPLPSVDRSPRYSDLLVVRVLPGLLAVVALVLPGAVRAGSPRRTAVVDVVERVAAAVVNIHSERTVTARRPEELFALAPSQNRINGMGTGIIIDPRGYIVTNQHVVEDVNVIRIRLADGTTLNAARRGPRPGDRPGPAQDRRSTGRCRSCRSAPPPT